MSPKFLATLIIGIIGIVLLLMINPFVKIDATEKGLMLTWGALDQKVLEPGIHWRWPIMQQVKQVTIQPIQLDHRVEVGGDGAITKDNQTIGADITMFYKYSADRLPEMYEKYGEDKIKSILNQTVRETFKGVIGNYDIFSLPAVQDEVRNKVWEDTKVKISEYPLELIELKIVNYDWSDTFDKQIETTMQRAQEVKQKQQELLIAEQEAQKLVKQAEAEKTSLITKAEGEKGAAALMAEAKALEGEGIKKYNESVAQNWDIELKKIQLEIERVKAERWNGVYVPNNMYGPIPVDTVGGVQGR